MIGVVMNPVAAGGGMARLWPVLAPMLRERLGPFELAETSRNGNGAELARQFAEGGCDLVIAAGGDGTIGQVADGLLQSGRAVQLGIVPLGTGTDFARNLDFGGDVVGTIASGRTRKIDAGRVTFAADGGGTGVRHFINVASLGLSGPTVRAVNASRQRRASGKVTFLYHTVIQLLRYRMQDVRVVIDDGETIDARIAVVAICNGRFFGGGMMIGPDARIDDGLFDVVIFRAPGKAELIVNLPKLYSGAHVRDRHATVRRARVVEVLPLGEGERPVLLDVDGESPGQLPARFEVLPGALTLRG